jgi:hypothetical protein
MPKERLDRLQAQATAIGASQTSYINMLIDMGERAYLNVLSVSGYPSGYHKDA